jgi:hypothetical protein
MVIGLGMGPSPGTTPPTPRRLLGQILKDMDLVSESQIQEALVIQKQNGGAIGAKLCTLGYVAKEEVLLALSLQLGTEVVDIDEFDSGGSGPDR